MNQYNILYQMFLKIKKNLVSISSRGLNYDIEVVTQSGCGDGEVVQETLSENIGGRAMYVEC